MIYLTSRLIILFYKVGIRRIPAMQSCDEESMNARPRVGMSSLSKTRGINQGISEGPSRTALLITPMVSQFPVALSEFLHTRKTPCFIVNPKHGSMRGKVPRVPAFYSFHELCSCDMLWFTGGV